MMSSAFVGREVPSPLLRYGRIVSAARRLVLPMLVVCAFAPVRVSLAAEDDAKNLLARMYASVGSLDYQGSFIYARNSRIDTLRIFHAGGEGAERERLLSTSGARNEIVRSGDSITLMQQDSPAVILPNPGGARLLPLVPETRGERFDTYYRVEVGGDDRVAGYRARVVDIVPRDGWRYGYRLWLEDSTGMPLRSAVVDARKRPLEQFMFVALELGAKPRESDLAPAAAADTTAPPVETPLEGGPRWRLVDPPPGYRFLRVQRSPQDVAHGEHLTYSDGLANVSIYVEPHDGAATVPPDRFTARGVLGICVHDTDAWRVTVLGDVPRATAERMALSVRASVPTAGR